MICRPFSLILLCLSYSSGSQVKLKTDQNLCPLLDGVFVSIMRRIFNPGYHKVNINIAVITGFIFENICRSFSRRWRSC